MPMLKAVEDELDRLNYVIKASEPWAHQYGKDPETHAKIIKVEVKLDRSLRAYFRDLAERVPKMVNWSSYMGQIQADFNVDVLINDSTLDGEDSTIMNVLLDPIKNGVFVGATAGEVIYNRPLGITPVTSFIQDAARARIAELVGKRLNKDGTVVDNPKAEYRITDTTRDIIRNSIADSLALNENYTDAISRLSSAIADPSRAGMIAQTESVNAYQIGLHNFGKESGAVGKEWESLNPDDECGDNADAGIIDLADSFPSGDSEPAAHPNCRCSLRLIYPEEMDSL